jgi:tRNA pseudouridine38-40 synthase
MRNILLTVSYDGTDFCGWQRQDDKNGGQTDRTVQGEIETALEKLCGQKITLYGSGRTDSGDHAIGQAANFYSPIDSMPAENYIRALNSFLPPDVRIIDARLVDENFNSRKSATSRIYRYFIAFGEPVTADNARFCWYVPNYTPDIERLNKYVSSLHGETDCAALAASGDESVSTNRYIDSCRFFMQTDRWGKQLLVFEIEANAFLWKMVRTLTGTLINLDKTAAPDDAFNKILASRNRAQAGVTAPPTGLFLYQIKFDGIRRHM